MVEKLESVPEDALSKHDLKQDKISYKETIKTTIDPSFGRKRWEVVTEAVAADEEDQGDIILRNLEGRNIVNLEQNVGKTMYVQADAPKEKQGGFYCEVCDCLMKDSQAYLDHLNSKKHNKLKGMTMQVTKVDAARVQQRMNMLKKKQENSQQKVNTFGEIEKKLEEEELKRKKEFEAKLKIKKKVKQQNQEIEDFLQQNSELLDSGLPLSFGSTKK